MSNVIDFLTKRAEIKAKLPNFKAKTEKDVQFLIDNMHLIEAPKITVSDTCG